MAGEAKQFFGEGHPDNGLREAFSYDPYTGWLFARHQDTDQPVGSKNGRGYITVSYQKKRLYAHRVAWFLVFSEWPEQIDHINWNKSDNRLVNLRSVMPRTNNAYRQGANCNNRTSGAVGVRASRPGASKPWFVEMKIHRRKAQFGSFFTVAEAAAAYRAAQAARIQLEMENRGITRSDLVSAMRGAIHGK